MVTPPHVRTRSIRTVSVNEPGDLLLQEVSEDLRREQMLKLWRRYGVYVLLAALGLVLGVAGYQGWKAWRTSQLQKSAIRFSEAATLAGDGKTALAAAKLAELGADGHGGYATAALMAEADIKARAGDVAGAREAYKKLAASGAGPLYRDLATLKDALLALENGDADIAPRLSGLLVEGNPWRYQALEALAAATRQKGDLTQAMEHYRKIADDLNAPQGSRARAAEALAALGAQAPAPSK